MEMGQVHECLEQCPDNMDKPQPWRFVKLGDIAEIKKGRVLSKKGR